MTDKTRTKKTAAEKAQEAFDVASRRLDRARSARDKLKTQLDEATAEVEAAQKRRDYLANDPDLPAVQNVDTYAEGEVTGDGTGEALPALDGDDARTAAGVTPA